MNNVITQGYMLPDENMPEIPKLLPAPNSSSQKPFSQSNQLRPPPPLKPAYSNCYNHIDENKKKNDADGKKTLFKCKKCNFRDANRENILMHVKGHYQQEGATDSILENNSETTLDDEVSVSTGDAPFRCGHCHQVSNWKHVIQRHCRLKHQGDIRVVVNGKNDTLEKTDGEEQGNETDYYNTNDEEYYKCVACHYHCNNNEEIITHIESKHRKETNNEFKCCLCMFSAPQKFELYEHLKLHGVSEPEDYINNSNFNTSLLENSNLYVKIYKCKACTYGTENKQEFMSHKQYHRSKGALFKCKFCSYSASKIQQLQHHLQIHGADILATNRIDVTTELDVIDMPLVVDTHMLKEVPLVWVSKEGKFSKMYKCRFCPHVNQRKVNIQDHEKMHNEHEEFRNLSKKTEDISYSCPDCSYVCNNAGVLSAHFKVHQGVNGQIHCFVDTNKTDEEQVRELSSLLNHNKKMLMNNEEIEDIEMINDLEIKLEVADIEKMLYFCYQCPARYLHKKELDTHIRFHGSRLFYRCDYCTYTARQKPHLLLHTNVHTDSYHQETSKLQRDFATSKDYPEPSKRVVDGAIIGNDSVWTVSSAEVNFRDTEMYKIANKNFACTKCPTKFYNNNLLSYHMTLHGGKHPYKCHTCDYSAITRNNLEKHERIHLKENHDLFDTQENAPKRILQTKNKEQSSLSYLKYKSLKNKKYRCQKCPCTFEKREQFKIHLSLHGSKQRYQCDKCDYSVKYYANYVQHVKKHNKKSKILSPQNEPANKEFTNDNTETSLVKLPLNSLPASTEPGMLKLSVADRQSLMILQEIRNNSSKDSVIEEKKLFWCAYCPYTSYRKDAVDNHINRHICISGIQNNYTCEHCDYTVPQSHFLREHTKIHFSPFKFHQPEGYMISKKIKLSYKKYNEDNNNEIEDENENILFEEVDDVEFKPPVNLPFDDNEEVTKIFINSNTYEMVESSLIPSPAEETLKKSQTNPEETKEDIKSS